MCCLFVTTSMSGWLRGSSWLSPITYGDITLYLNEINRLCLHKLPKIYVRFLLEKAPLVAQIASLRDVITLNRLVAVCASTALNGLDHPRDKYLHLDRISSHLALSG